MFRVAANATRDGQLEIGRAPNQTPNVPPPVFADGKRITIHLNGTNATDVALESQVARRSPRPTPTRKELDEYAFLNATRSLLVMITPSACRGVVDVPPILPKLTYFCNFLPNICDNIRSHPDWPATNQMILTYDPFTPKGTRRRRVCPTATTQAYQTAGKCDLRQHDPAYWKVAILRFLVVRKIDAYIPHRSHAMNSRSTPRWRVAQGTLSRCVYPLVSSSTKRCFKDLSPTSFV